jgi:UDP-N-acetylglucosamine 2-epimerase (non-hydrolysing)
MKTVVTIVGIRPDLIRMSFVFQKLDQHFHHIMIHTGQHYEKNLADVFYDELNIRAPDYVLNTGRECSNHYEQLSYLSKAIPELLKKENIQPELILFLGDSNTAAVSLPLKKEGYKIGHIEAGMRSYDKRMLEEINRMVCDICSDILFVYHDEYKNFLEKENITKNVHVVGNTIVEPLQHMAQKLQKKNKKNNLILVDIHRPENTKYPVRVKNILEFARSCSEKYNLPVKLLYFKRLKDTLDKNNILLDGIEMVPLMSYTDYIQTVYDSRFIISDSGTGQEEPCLLKTPVLVPRDFTERPQSYKGNCSFHYSAESPNNKEAFEWLEKIESGELKMDTSWLGDGTTSQKIINILNNYLYMNGK